ncbi:MAG: DNA-protecting protein DprA, partial [Muribaculaceae bacterium]|nr:DNA-protecting protein DprA [Muribaculaceae bacterium]
MSVSGGYIDEYCMAFGLVGGMGVDLANKILEVIPSEREFFQMPQRDLEAIAGRRHKMLSAEYRASVLDDARRELDLISQKGIKYYYFRDSYYPSRLLHAPDAPILLFGIGECDLNATKIVSVVGTRHATHYGIDMTNRLVDGLAAYFPDIIIVSGLAYGIDVAAHNAAIRNNLTTVGVLAHGLNQIYPAAHRSVASKMARGGGMLV